jgi:solute carrier family 8 (sodium/calcium exchanger)
MMEDAASLALKQSGAQKPSVMTAKINARRGLTGGKRVLANTDTHAAASGGLSQAQAAKPVEEKKEIVTSASGAKISFSSPTYAAEEGKGKVTLHVLRTEDTSGTVHIQYSTSDGTALSGEDFEHARGILTFAPGDAQKDIVIKLIDDTSYEPDENFYVSLKEAKGGKKGPGDSAPHSFGDYDIACVTILNDDKPGTFGFENANLTVTEDNEYATFKVLRTSGCDGDISVSYNTIDGTAKSGSDFDQTEGTLNFADGETEKVIKVKLIEDDQFEKNETFKIQLAVTAPGALLKDEGVAEVTILGDEEAEAFAKEIAQIMKKKMDEMNGSVDTATYADQFNEAMNICGEEGEEPGTMDYVMHFLTFGWKVIFATVPPTSWSGGWVTFFVALAYIGVLTAFVADIASIFGCLLTLPDAITAITFVALGTSLPDTFASKSAATQDETADNSVGNVTGSNSVNVFLGLGLPWLIACGANSSYTAPDVPGTEWLMVNGEYSKEKVTIDGETISFDKGAFPVLAGTMGSSVILFCACAVACIITIYIRRWTGLGELGGPSFAKKVTAVFFIGLWMVYVVVSSLLEKGHIDPFM